MDPVEPFLEEVSRHLAQEVRAFVPELGNYAKYALNGQGKHLRPALMGLTARALGKTTEAHLKVAVIIEIIHLATLLHDDVMDEAEIRRGRPTMAAHWGNETAILFGDCLFAHALTLAASFPTPDICRAVAMATNTVCSGEILQMQQRGSFKYGRADYFRVLEMKTAELFALACDLSAWLSGTPVSQRTALRQFGLAFGTAYQIYDDCVDLFGSEAAAGKSLGTDLAKGKLTLPMLLLLEQCDAAERAALQKVIQSWQPGYGKRVGEMLLKYDTLGGSLAILEQYLAKARECLEAVPSPEGRERLLALTECLGRETHSLAATPESSL
jgi:octaprenyl-diphosphate synthase